MEQKKNKTALIGSALSLGPGVYFLSVNASGFLASLFQKKKEKKRRTKQKGLRRELGAL
jgi:hypothetical protein